jgi:hypothetical protein
MANNPAVTFGRAALGSCRMRFFTTNFQLGKYYQLLQKNGDGKGVLQWHKYLDSGTV